MASEKPKKKFYKRWWFWLIVVVVILFIAIGSSGGGDDSSSNSKTTTTTNSSNNSSSGIHKINKVNFKDTTGEQTTTIDKAEIKDISDMGLVDDKMKNIKYAIVVHMSVANKASDTATVYPEQGHIVLPDGTQLDGSSNSDAKGVFDSGDIEKAATVSGNVFFPITEKQAKSIKKATFKFEVICGDSNMTDKHYEVQLNF